MAKSSLYPSYDVWDQHSQWDDHTRGIVGKRRAPVVANRFLTHAEAMLLQAVAAVLVDELRLEVLTYITQHIDESLASPIGEDQRKVGLPEKKTLYRLGLAGIEEVSQKLFQKEFLALSKDQQIQVLGQIEQEKAPASAIWSQVPQKPFFKRMLHDVVSACYSHPLVWSDIGYGGPAYPRGYVRSEKGLLDPWEAKQDGK